MCTVENGTVEIKGIARASDTSENFLIKFAAAVLRPSRKPTDELKQVLLAAARMNSFGHFDGFKAQRLFGAVKESKTTTADSELTIQFTNRP